MWYTDEISGVDADMWVEFYIDFIKAHGWQYTCKVGRKNHTNWLGGTWSERVYYLEFTLYPHEYQKLISEV